MKPIWGFDPARLLSPSGAVLLAALLVGAAAPDHISAAEATGDGIRFNSPWPGALISEGPVVVTGALPEESPSPHFLLNGRVVDGFTVSGGHFSGTLLPASGFNELEVRAGDEKGRLSFVYGVKASGESPYVYHPPLLEEECGTCHGEEKKGRKMTEASLCYRCHKAKHILFPHVHGPVAAGKCLICHDPHGSSLHGLTRESTTKMCVLCHDQPSTQQHTSTSRSRVCTLCHDPHYSLRKHLLRTSFGSSQ